MMIEITAVPTIVEITIYALVEPGTEHTPDPYVRYVGQTEGSLRRRLSEHIADARAGRMGNEALCTWILGLLRSRRRPALVLLKTSTSHQDADLDEIYHIRLCADLFPDLLNDQHNPHRSRKRPFTRPYLERVGAA